MKRLLLLLFFILSAMSATGEELLFDFTRPVKLRIGQAEARGQKYSGGTFSWEGGRFPYLEFFFDSPALLPEFKKAKFTAEIEIPEGSVLNRFALRFTDKDGEVFQYSRPTAALKPGKHTLTWEVDADAPSKQSWGAKKNGRVDHPLRLSGIALGYPDTPPAGTLRIRRISAVFDGETPAVGQVKVTLSTASNPVRVYNPEAADAVRIRLENRHAKEQRIRFSCTLRDHEKSLPGGVEQAFTLAPKERAELELPVPPGRGIRYVDYKLSDGKTECAGTRSFAVMVPAGPTPGRAEGFLFGVHAHPQRYPQAEQELEARALALCGAKIVRHGSQWTILQPRKDVWNFDSYDFTVDCFGKYGIEFESAFAFTPHWATAKDWKSLNFKGRTGRPMPDREAFAEYVRRVVARYRGRIRFYEVWNEPELVSFADFPAEQYTELMKIAYTETKKIDPGATVMTAGFVCMPPNPGLTDQLYMEKALTQGRGFYDIFAFHGHGRFENYESQIERLLAMRKRLGIEHIPWYPNETAISSVNIGEFEQAKTLFRKLVFSWASGAMGYTWYDLRNDGCDPGENEHNFGMLTKDFQPKAVYCVYNAIVRNLGGGTFEKSGTAPEGGRFFEFSVPGARTVAFWNEPHGGNSGELYWVRSDAKRAFLIDLFDNSAELPLHGGYLLLPAGETPAMLRLEPAGSGFETAGTLASSAGNILLPAEGRIPFKLRLTNPLRNPLSIRLEPQLPEGLALEKPLPETGIPAGGSAEVAGVFTASADFRPPEDPELPLAGTLDGNPLPEGMKLKLRRALRIPAGKFGYAPTFTLNTARHYRTLAPSDPGRPQLQWQGAADLSARLFPAFANDAFLLKAVVTDDRHCQPHSGIEAWMGDNLQLLLAPAGAPLPWEIGFSLLDSGREELHVWNAPRDCDMEKLKKEAVFSITRDEEKKETVYTIRIPWRALGLAGQPESIRFNIVLNENDGDMRKGLFTLAMPTKEPAGFPLLVPVSR
ncbi:MAG: hypothetical protein HPZ91_18950 [Lentisphaeria bacterium]|nr:hypothetical protein [Lentisphaeria bacterium]